MFDSPIEIPTDKEVEVVAIFKNSTPEIRAFMLQIFGTEFLPLNIMERVTSFEAACEVLSIIPSTITDLLLPTGAPVNTLAFIKLSIIVSALNENWVANLNADNQQKFCLFPSMQAGVMIYTANTYLFTSTTVPTNLLLASEELARHLGNHFGALLNEYYLANIAV